MKTILRMMDHLYWADGRILDALEASHTKDAELLKLVRHVAVAEQVWLSRLQGKGNVQYWLWEEAENLPEIRRMFEANAKEYRSYRQAGRICAGSDDQLQQPEWTFVPDLHPGHPAAGAVTWAISPGTDQPGPSDGIGRACPC